MWFAAPSSPSAGVAGSGDVPNWASMPSSQRDVWEQVAIKARREMAAAIFPILGPAIRKAIAEAMGRRIAPIKKAVTAGW